MTRAVAERLSTAFPGLGMELRPQLCALLLGPDQQVVGDGMQSCCPHPERVLVL